MRLVRRPPAICVPTGIMDSRRTSSRANATCSATAELVLIPLPGHTPGTMGAKVDLDRDGSFLLVSDAVSLRENLDTDTVPRNTWNAEALLKSFAEIRRIEKAGATVICGHDDAQWQSLRKGAEAYE